MTDFKELREALAAGPTEGPWGVEITEHPYKLNEIQRTHIERRIFTKWDHPQLKGPIGVVNRSIGLGGINFTSIEEVDAAYIAACDPSTIRTLLDERDAAEKDAARYRFLRDSYPADGGLWVAMGVPNSPPGIACWRHEAVDTAIDKAMEQPE